MAKRKPRASPRDLRAAAVANAAVDKLVETLTPLVPALQKTGKAWPTSPPSTDAADNGAKPLETVRGPGGRFQKGAKPGPGRPRRAAGPVAPRGLSNPLTLEHDALLVRVAVDNWKKLVRNLPLDVLVEFVIEQQCAGFQVPCFVRTYLFNVLLENHHDESLAELVAVHDAHRQFVPPAVRAAIAPPASTPTVDATSRPA